MKGGGNSAMTFRTSVILFLALFLNLSVQCQKYDAEVVSYETVVTADASSVKMTKSIEIIINNENGTEYGMVTIPHSNNISISKIEGHVEDALGNVVKVLRKSDIIDRNEFTEAFYSDRFIKGFILDYGNFPYKVVYSYTTIEKRYLSICYWNPASLNIRVKDATLTVILPNDFSYKLYSYKVPDSSIVKKEKTTELLFRSSWPEPFKKEVYSNILSEIPYVKVLPEFFENNLVGSWNSWVDYGNWIHGLNEGKDLLTDDEKLKVDALVQGITDKREIVRALYHYLQDNTRYINVVEGLGALEPYPASYVCKYKYGDCKALTIYMKALLTYVDIESYYTIINASDPPMDFVYDFPSHQFNHVILAVPIENDTIWLENTNKHIPCGYLSKSTRNRPALMIEKFNSRLIRTPNFDKNDVLTSEKEIYEVSLTESTKLSLANICRGELFEFLNAIDGGANKNDVDRYIRQAMVFDNYDVKDWKINKSGREDSKIELKVNISLNKFVKPIGKDYYFSLSSSGVPEFEIPARRKLPVLIPEPIYYIDTLIYNLPEGYGLKNQFEPVRIESPHGNFSLSLESAGNTIIVRREFLMLDGSIELSKYPEFYSFIDEVRKSCSPKIVIKPLNT